MPSPVEQQKQVSAMYGSVGEFERMLYDAEDADAEVVRATMRRVWARIDAALAGSGGSVVERSQTSFTVLWGVDSAREDDPERAVRAALALEEGTRELAAADLLPLQIGVTTGSVLLSPAPGGGFAASGHVMSIVNRLPAAVPEGGIAITLETYRLVRGVFLVEGLEPIRIRGRKESVLSISERREASRLQNQSARSRRHRDEDGRPRSRVEALDRCDGNDAGRPGNPGRDDRWRCRGREVERSSVRAAGMGKKLSVDFWLFLGRATPEMVDQPYALIRDVFAYRFKIQDSDSPAVGLSKLEQGIAEFLGPNAAESTHLIGHLLGFELPGSPYLQGGDAQQLHDRALTSIIEFFVAVASKKGAGVAAWLLLEGLHWADERSLDLLNRLVEEDPRLPLGVIGTARPLLYERRPTWGSGQDFHARLISRSAVAA